MSWRPDKPYNEWPMLPPDLDQVESRAVLKACIPARAALAELRQAGELLPDPGLLTNLLPILEARDSSEIENILTTCAGSAVVPRSQPRKGELRIQK
ncbi:MAG: Fic/DOC family N-terminal domain-containing protein [Xanthomonadales bacterium]|nr:Fic/DOC family N-terminal domain-containing protein [Xanthomonadales bacterium]